MSKKAMMTIVAKMCEYQSASCRGLDMADMARELLDIASVPANAVISEIPVSDYNQVIIYFYINGDNNYYSLLAGDGMDGSKANFLLYIEGKNPCTSDFYFLDNVIKIDANYFKEGTEMTNTIKKMTKTHLDDVQTMDIYTYTYTVWGHDADDINSTWEGAITVNALLKASEILGLYSVKYPDHGTPTDCSLYTMHQMSIDCDMMDSEYVFTECDWMTISDNCQKWRDTMYDLDIKDVITPKETKMDKIRIYGKTLNRWTEAQTINGIARDMTTQIEIAYKDYYLDGTVAGTGSEDFSPERYSKEVATYEARTWDGCKRNRGGHKAWDQRDTYTVKRDSLKTLKGFCKIRYATDDIMMVKF